MDLSVAVRRGLGVNAGRLRSELRALIAVYGYPDWGLDVRVTTDRTLRRLNAARRGKDAPTDVLSFPFYGTIRQPGTVVRQPHARLNQLGHLFVSVPFLHRFCAREEECVNERFRLLLSHGIAHLLGHDHEEERQRRRMEAAEEWALDAAAALLSDEERATPLVDVGALERARRLLEGTEHWETG